MAARKAFRFSAAHDVLLLKERLNINPTNIVGWRIVATNLNSLIDIKFDVDHRSCKDRAERLLTQYKKEDTANLRRSGTDEEYEEKEALLEEIASLEREQKSVEKEKIGLKAPTKRKREEDANAARVIREAGLKRREVKEPESDDSDTFATEKPKRLTKTSMLQYLEEKQKTTTALRREELELEKERLALQKRELDLRAEAQRAEKNQLMNMMEILKSTIEAKK